MTFDHYLEHFTYTSRKEMKISTQKMIDLVTQDQAVVIDIRFREEYAAWHLGFTHNIPLSELPHRLDELPKDKLIITACPHNDRANIARMFLTLKGYNARYLVDGLLRTMDALRGDAAKELYFALGGDDA